MSHPSTAGYAEQADGLLVRYEARSPEAVLAGFLPWLPPGPAEVLDVGAGTGRDAAYLARLGHQVVAVEPVRELREGAQRLHPEPITWVDDALPSLSSLDGRAPFAFVLANAVWMHLDASERAEAMARIAALLGVGGRFALTLRHGPVPQGRRMFPVSGEETAALGAQHGLVVKRQERRASLAPENVARGIAWTQLVLQQERP